MRIIIATLLVTFALSCTKTTVVNQSQHDARKKREGDNRKRIDQRKTY